MSIFFTIIFFFIKKYNVLKSIATVEHDTYGEVVYPIGFGVITFIYYEQIELWLAGILVFCLSDVFAWLGGYILRSKTKTLLGSSLYFISSLIFIYQLAGLDMVLSITAAFILTLVERFSRKGLDNITAPIAYDILIKLLL